MRLINPLIGITLLLTASVRAFPQAEDSWDRGYSLMMEAYRLREAGEEATAREKMARALALFRRTAAERASLEFRPEVDFAIEESPLGVNLIENRALFKIEFSSGSPPPGESEPDSAAVLRLQQMIVQSLAQVIQDNAELKKSISRLEQNTEETSEIPNVAQNVEDIRDRTDDIYDQVDRLASDSETLQAVENLAGEVSDLSDALDLLRDILDIVQDIKGDTDGIGDLESGISDVKSEVENSGG